MKDYLEFVWQSFRHPNSFVDLLPAFQLAIFILFIFYIIRAFVSLIKESK